MEALSTLTELNIKNFTFRLPNGRSASVTGLGSIPSSCSEVDLDASSYGNMGESNRFCSTVFLVSSEKQGLEGVYGLSPSLVAENHRHNEGSYNVSTWNQAESSRTVDKPVVCMQEGDLLVFDISTSTGGATVPVYLPDSLLSSDSDFDYGVLRAARSAGGGADPIDVVVMQMNSAGVHVFAGGLDDTDLAIVVVLEQGTSCPTEANIVP